MTDEEIEKKIKSRLQNMSDGYQTHLEYGGERDGAFEEAMDFENATLDYINCLKKEIAGLTGKADALEADRDNLLRTLEEANEEITRLKAACKSAIESATRMETLYKVKCTELECKQEQVRKETAKEVLQDIIAKSSDDFGSREIATSDLIIIFKKYGVEVEE